MSNFISQWQKKGQPNQDWYHIGNHFGLHQYAFVLLNHGEDVYNIELDTNSPRFLTEKQWKRKKQGYTQFNPIEPMTTKNVEGSIKSPVDDFDYVESVKPIGTLRSLISSQNDYDTLKEEVKTLLEHAEDSYLAQNTINSIVEDEQDDLSGVVEKLQHTVLTLKCVLIGLTLFTLCLAFFVYLISDRVTVLSDRTVELAGRDIGLQSKIQNLSADVYSLIESHIESGDIAGRE